MPETKALMLHSYKIAKFLVPILICLTINEFTVKDSFSFAKEIVEQDSNFYLSSLDVDSLFTNISREKTINFAQNQYMIKMIVLKV